ncbi:MAG: tyrosine-protein phosphatase [Bacteroidales bacterium]|nr:tyrosine-protein phosphatase [Bacteroidales bacterium]
MGLFVSTVVSAQQFLPVRGIVNARDLGGYVMQDGRTVRDGLLLRSAHLAEATDADLQYLSQLPTGTVIDMRKEGEKKGKVNRTVPGAKYVPLQIDATGNVAAGMTEKEKKIFAGHKKFDVKKIIVAAAFNKKAQAVAREMYPILLFNPESQVQFAAFFRHVLATEHGAVLYHCTQGKDRTGIASALLLAALGADRETIVADFDATNKVYEADVKKYTRRVRFWGGKEEQVAVVKAFLGCNTDNFIQALARIDREYGSLDAYLHGPMGLTDEDIQTLRARYLR